MNSQLNQQIGELGETLVARWLNQQNWEILHCRWRCRWGEIDLIAQGYLAQSEEKILAFVEVKTRSRGNWDADGLMAITLAKQAKLKQTARLFLAQHPEKQDFPCQFDVALVRYQQIHSTSLTATSQPLPVSSVELGQPVLVAGHQLILQDYIQLAFD
ncbi:MAG: YraN family protein [Coleofasciculaceae cyanobacterium]